MSKFTDTQCIIAIGASAGGLESIAAFFDHTPMDAVSYILIQHLSSDFKSQMGQILARHSKLEIIEVTKDLPVVSNKIYLIPSSKFMVIKNGVLILSDKKDKTPPHLTIDHFFISLAKDLGDRAIGVILSGTGHDGSKGIQAIKEAGGMVIVQDPITARFDEMPLSAIATKCADAILSPEAMPQVIEDYVNDGIITASFHDKNDEISEESLQAILNLIKEALPIDFTDYKRPTILRRISKRMHLHDFSQIDKYYAYLKENKAEIELLSNDFLIGVTSFFRDPEAFKIIEKTVIPNIVSQHKSDEVLKIWVAGCATGEEAYSFAILVKEHLNKIKKSLEVKIFATDINKAALDIASKGIYNESKIKLLSKERLKKFFIEEGTDFKVKHGIRKMLIFAQHDLVKNPPYCNIDLISCRNLLIYMNTSLQKKVFSMMHFGLKKDGYLFLGPSENAAILKDDFNEVSSKWNILKSNKSGRSVKFDAFSSPMLEGLRTTTTGASKVSAIPLSKDSIVDHINVAILEESGFSGICTDESLKVLQAFGDTSFFLKNKNFNFNLNDLLPERISATFKAAAHKAISLQERVELDDLQYDIEGASGGLSVDIILKPVFLNKLEEQLLLILFKKNTDKPEYKKSLSNLQLDQLTKDHLIGLERELLQAKNNLNAAYERIESSNENMQSFNEELQSANEEMQSANEEMQSTNEELQSVNEELQTINKEHQITNAELTELNDDLNNYFRSNMNGQLFVDRDLLLKKYSPQAVKHINIRESDIGRPLSNITTNMKLETLIEDIKKVIAKDETITRETESSDGKIYQIMTMPYIRKNSKLTDGAIISFYDITELKNISKELDISNKKLDKSNKSLLRINADLNNFVYTASHDLNAPILNIEMVLNILNERIDMKDPIIMKLSGMMHSAIVTFKDVINDLSQLGLMEAEMLEESSWERFEDIYKEISESISEQIKTSKALLTIDFQEKEVRFPKKYLRSIMLNLITNALKFSPKSRSPKITVKAVKSDDYIVLSVEDNGIGIDQERIDFIFRMYRRINEDMEGQGVGLYLVKKIIDASGGKIEVTSELNKGSTFSIFFEK